MKMPFRPGDYTVCHCWSVGHQWSQKTHGASAWVFGGRGYSECWTRRFSRFQLMKHHELFGAHEMLAGR
jgi:hypothetical protein